MQFTFFSESLEDVFNRARIDLSKYVKALPESHFDGIDRDQFSELTAAKFALEEMPSFAAGAIERDPPEFTQGSDVVLSTVYFPYTGNLAGFRYYHGSRPLPCPVFEYNGELFHKTYRMARNDLQRLDEHVDRDVKLVQQYVQQAQEMIPRFNKSLVHIAAEEFERRVHEISENRKARATLATSRFTVRKRSDAAEKLLVPIKRKPIPVQRPEPAEPLQEYVLGMNEYNDILSSITSMALVMERTPSVFVDMNEEPLRTILLVALNGLYEGQATGETFNGHGKTDILIRREDRNVFIAECLMWKGPAYLDSKMNDQLFRYAMWRDSKLALIVFNRGGIFSQVVAKMKEAVRSHSHFLRDLPWTHESGARYLFRRHDDPDRHFILSAVAFDVPDGA